MNHPKQTSAALSPAEREVKARELESLQTRMEALEQELAGQGGDADWQSRYYGAYYATTGFMLGIFGAAMSLLFNIIGSVSFPQLQGEHAHPLRLIQVYLTFPLGEQALSLDTGLALVIGCCLYLATGMVYGVFFNLVLTGWAPRATLGRRMIYASALSLALWLVNFYGILSWLQPLLLHGNWIVELVPWWVAALTHLVFGWTMALVYPWGQFTPYHVQAEER